MCIDKARQNDTPLNVNYFGVARYLSLNFAGGSDALNYTVANEQTAVRDDREIEHLRPDARPWRTSQRDHLRCVKNGDRLQD
jgi:hypothetical protein